MRRACHSLDQLKKIQKVAHGKLISTCTFNQSNPPVAGPRVPEVLFQAHSRNDDREWRQLVLKGSNNLKLDMHFVEGKLCGPQTQVRI